MTKRGLEKFKDERMKNISVRKLFRASKYYSVEFRLLLLNLCECMFPERVEEIRAIFNEIENQLEGDLELEEEIMQEINKELDKELSERKED